MLIGINNSDIQNIQHSGSGKTPKQCLYDVFQIWEASSNKEDNEYPYTLNGLIHLLNDIDHSALANNVREALSSKISTVRGKLHQKKKNQGTDIGTSCMILCIKCSLLFSS